MQNSNAETERLWHREECDAINSQWQLSHYNTAFCSICTMRYVFLLWEMCTHTHAFGLYLPCTLVRFLLILSSLSRSLSHGTVQLCTHQYLLTRTMCVCTHCLSSVCSLKECLSSANVNNDSISPPKIVTHTRSLSLFITEEIRHCTLSRKSSLLYCLQVPRIEHSLVHMNMAFNSAICHRRIWICKALHLHTEPSLSCHFGTALCTVNWWAHFPALHLCALPFAFHLTTDQTERETVSPTHHRICHFYILMRPSYSAPFGPSILSLCVPIYVETLSAQFGATFCHWSVEVVVSHWSPSPIIISHLHLTIVNATVCVCMFCLCSV